MQENKPMMVVGLGNPGPEYQTTRHNVGFMAVTALAGADADWKTMKNARVAITDIDGRRVIFVMPMTYMNLSGNAVGALMQFYKIPLENLVVIHDDMDIKIGALREKVGGGSAGHNGIKSIDAMVGADYRRIRIGIGHPRDLELKISPADWVLGRFSTEQMAQINQVIKDIRLF